MSCFQGTVVSIQIIITLAKEKRTPTEYLTNMIFGINTILAREWLTSQGHYCDGKAPKHWHMTRAKTTIMTNKIKYMYGQTLLLTWLNFMYNSVQFLTVLWKIGEWIRIFKLCGYIKSHTDTVYIIIQEAGSRPTGSQLLTDNCSSCLSWNSPVHWFIPEWKYDCVPLLTAITFDG